MLINLEIQRSIRGNACLPDFLVGTGGWAYFKVPNKSSLKAYSEAILQRLTILSTSTQMFGWLRVGGKMCQKISLFLFVATKI
jgi:hypothetical protein